MACRCALGLRYRGIAEREAIRTALWCAAHDHPGLLPIVVWIRGAMTWKALLWNVNVLVALQTIGVHPLEADEPFSRLNEASSVSGELS